MTDDETTVKFWGRVDKDGPVPAIDPTLGNCWLWERPGKNGYGVIYFAHGYGLKKEGKKYIELAHRYSWELHTGNPAKGLIDHRCQVRH